MSWVSNELTSGQIKDKRLEKRFSLILESLSKNPQESIPAACQGWSETQAAYRFWIMIKSAWKNDSKAIRPQR